MWQVKNVFATAKEGVGSTNFTIELVKSSMLIDDPIDVTFSGGTKVPGGPGLDTSERIFKWKDKITVTDTSFDNATKIITITVRLTSQMPKPSGNYTSSEKKAKRSVPVGDPGIEISPLGGVVNIFSSPIAGSTDTQLVFKFKC